MSEAVRAKRGWAVWLVFILGLIAVPLNAFAILFWAWVVTHHATDTAREDTIVMVAFCALGLVMVSSIVGMVRRWNQWVVAMSLILLFPAVFVLATVLVGFL